MSTFHDPGLTDPNPPGTALTPGFYTANIDPSAANTQKKHFRCKVCGSITQGILAFSALLLGVVMALWTYASLEQAKEANRKAEWANKMAAWSSLQAFRDDCRAQNETAQVMTEDCSEALNRPLSHPPRIGTHLTRRAVIDASLHSSELASATLNPHHVQCRLVFIGMFIVVCTVFTYRALSLQAQTDDEDIDVDYSITDLEHPWTGNANTRNRAFSELALSSQEEPEAINYPVTAIATSMNNGTLEDESELRRRPVDGSSRVADNGLDPQMTGFEVYEERELEVVFKRGSLIAAFWHENWIGQSHLYAMRRHEMVEMVQMAAGGFRE